MQYSLGHGMTDPNAIEDLIGCRRRRSRFSQPSALRAISLVVGFGALQILVAPSLDFSSREAGNCTHTNPLGLRSQ